jgi:hypothetical protein
LIPSKLNLVKKELFPTVNRRAAADILGLARKLDPLGEQICDLEDLIRDKPIAGEKGVDANARGPFYNSDPLHVAGSQSRAKG